ncbi:MAG: hypothetical protein GX900_03610 [Clostridiaceae bacterium]|nr:hypothetical protein [Clostridiaceae bacterium]
MGENIDYQQKEVSPYSGYDISYDKFSQFGTRLGLERMEVLLTALGNPQDNLKYCHIAGTNGKGSVSATLTSILAAANFRVGLYTSPFVERFGERIRILSGRDAVLRWRREPSIGEISPDDFNAALAKVKSALIENEVTAEASPTMFEVLTTIAFLQFDKYACDYVVLETGLGGRLDSTNIIRQPEVVVITALGYDHCERLGYTMAEIAHEKAGIFRTGVPVIALDPRHVFSVDAAEGASAYNQLLTEAAAKKADIFFVDPTCFRVNTADFAGQSYSFTNIPLGLEDYLSSRGATDAWLEALRTHVFRTPLLGQYQIGNTALSVLAAFIAYPELTQSVEGLEVIDAGMGTTFWPCRCEMLTPPLGGDVDSEVPSVMPEPLIIADGAHNTQGSAAFRASLAALQKHLPDGRKRLTVLWGFLEDKPWRDIVRETLADPALEYYTFVCTEPLSPRALPAERLAEFIQTEMTKLPRRRRVPVHIHAEVDSAIDTAWRENSRSDGWIAVWGSLYLVGEVSKKCRNRVKWAGRP